MLANPERVHLSAYFDTMVETEQLSLEQVMQLPVASWQPTQHRNPSFPPMSVAVWFRVSWHQDTPFRGVIDVDRPYLDEVDFHLVVNGKPHSEFLMGDQRSFSHRPIPVRSLAIPIDVSAGVDVSLFIRVNSRGAPIQFQTIRYSERQFLQSQRLELLIHCLYLGGIVIILIYNTFLFFSLRERTYIYYLLHTVSLAVALFIVMGYGNELFWPNKPYLNTYAILLAAPIYRLTMYGFILHFLRLQVHSATTAKILWFAMLIEVLAIMLMASPWGKLFNFFAGLVQVVILPIILIVATRLWLQGVKEARFFVIAWTVWCVGLIYYIISSHLVWFEYRSLSMIVLMYSHLLETVLAGLALADRINLSKQQESELRCLSETHARNTEKLLLTQQQKVAAEQQAKEAIASSLKLKNDFLTAISHELRTPMNGIFGGLQLISRSDSSLDPTIDLIRSSAKDMMRLVNDILTYTEIQAGQLNCHLEPVELRPILEKMRRRYEALCEEKGLQLVWHVAEVMPQQLISDREKIQTILSKLLDNAVKFTDHGTVSLLVDWTIDGAYQADPLLSFLIRDTGIGIDQAEGADLFAPFQQKQAGFQRRFSGLGIGLTICRRFSEVLGGDIDMQSSLGKGTNVMVHLPATSVELVSVPVEIQSVITDDLPILVVEDNPVNQKVLKKMLEKLGYRSLVADNGAEALRALDFQPVSLILMDLQMPVMDGFSCTKQIRRRAEPLKSIPIIAVTANIMDADRDRCLRSGMNDYIQKPIKIELLESTLSNYLRQVSLE